jgi:hypothetical protein
MKKTAQRFLSAKLRQYFQTAKYFHGKFAEKEKKH